MAPSALRTEAKRSIMKLQQREKLTGTLKAQ
jgi:hypothetical protein